jgi:hypothetical protein
MTPCTIDPLRLQHPTDCNGQRLNQQCIPDGEMLDFVMAVDLFKKVNQLAFLRTSEIYELMLFLGYRKVSPPMEQISQVRRARREWEPLTEGRRRAV